MAKHWRHTIRKEQAPPSIDELAEQLPDFARLMEERKSLEKEMKTLTGQQNKSSSLPFTPEIPSMQQRKRAYAKWQKKRDKKRSKQAPKTNSDFNNPLSKSKFPNRSKRMVDERFQNDIIQPNTNKTKQRKKKITKSPPRREKKQIDSFFEMDDFKRAKKKTDKLMDNKLIKLKKDNSGLQTKPSEPSCKQVDDQFTNDLPQRFQNTLSELRKTVIHKPKTKELKNIIKPKNREGVRFNRPAKAIKRLRKKKVDSLFSISIEDEVIDVFENKEKLKKAKLKELKTSQTWESLRDKNRFTHE